MRILIAIPAYNEEKTIGQVIRQTKAVFPNYDLIVVNDGSRDRTAEIVRNSPATLVSLPCNLGYSNAIETILNYALKGGYDAVATLDADGQHNPEHLKGLLERLASDQSDVIIGSRYIVSHSYKGNPLGRRIGMTFFSIMTKLLTKRRIYDTTSGMKAIRRRVIPALLVGHFIDFHAEALIHLLRSGFTIEEYPIAVAERQHGISMYSLLSNIWYPITTLLVIFIELTRPANMLNPVNNIERVEE